MCAGRIEIEGSRMKTPSVRKNLLFSTVYQVLLLAAPLITAPYISRVLGPDNIGIYSYTYSIQTYFAMFAALGTISYGTREISRNRNDEKERSILFWEIELLTVVTTMICLMVWGIWICLNNQYQIYYIILSVNLLAVMFDISWFYMGIEQFQYIVRQNALFKLFSIVSLFIWVKDENDLGIYILIMALSVFLGNLSMWIYLPRFIKGIRINQIHIWPHFKETIIYFVPTVASSIYTVLDKTLIGAITKDTSENGYYEQATKIINMAKSLAFVSLNSVLESRMSYLFAEKKYDEIKQRTNQSLNYIFFMGIGIVFGLIGVASKFVPLFFGKGYDRVVVLLKLLGPIVLIIGISNCLGSHYYNPAGLRALSAKFLIIGSVVNLILNCIFIPYCGSAGAACASIIAELVITVLYVTKCKGFVKLKELWQYSWKRLLAGVLMLVVVTVVGNQTGVNVYAVGLQVGAGILTYSISLLLLKDDFVIGFIKGIFTKFRHG